METSCIRIATTDDAAAMAAIYAPYVRETVISFDTSLTTEEEFRDRIVSKLMYYPVLIAESQGRPVGFAYTSAFVGRAAYRFCEETTIYMAKDCRHQGLGGKLYKALEDLCQLRGVITLCACIGVPHGPDDRYLTHNSADFHAHLGYETVGTFDRCGRKFGKWYDMVWMQKHLADHPAQPEEVRPFMDLSWQEQEACGIQLASE